MSIDNLTGVKELPKEIDLKSSQIVIEFIQSTDRFIGTDGKDLSFIKRFNLKQHQDRFERSTRVSGILHPHPNLILPREYIRERDEHSDIGYIASDYFHSKTLAERLKEGPIAPHEAIRILRGVSVAVDYLEQHGIVHRDLKPANILTTDDEVKVIDWDLARNWDLLSLESIEQVIGSIGNIEPKYARFRTGHDEHVDRYSLGILAYLMFYGTHPQRTHLHEDQYLQSVWKDPIKDPPMDRYADTILRQLDQNPLRRFENGKEFVDALAKRIVYTKPQPSKQAA